TTVGDTPGGDDRHHHRIDHLRQQGEQAGLLALVDAGERAPMPSRLGSLDNDRIDAAIFEDARFVNGGGAAKRENACALDGVDHLRWWEPEMKADDLRLGS